MKTKKAPNRAGKKPNPVAALRRELAVLRVRECSERLEKETAQRLLKMNADEIGKLRDTIKRHEDYIRWQRRDRDEFDRQACAAAQVDLPRYAMPSAQRALVEALGTVQMLRGGLSVTNEDRQREAARAESATASLEKLRTAIRTWAESYFPADDPARAWVLSMLDPVESRGGIVAMSNGSSIAAAAEGTLA